MSCYSLEGDDPDYSDNSDTEEELNRTLVMKRVFVRQSSPDLPSLVEWKAKEGSLSHIDSIVLESYHGIGCES